MPVASLSPPALPIRPPGQVTVVSPQSQFQMRSELCRNTSPCLFQDERAPGVPQAPAGRAGTVSRGPAWQRGYQGPARRGRHLGSPARASASCGVRGWRGRSHPAVPGWVGKATNLRVATASPPPAGSFRWAAQDVARPAEAAVPTAPARSGGGADAPRMGKLRPAAGTELPLAVVSPLLRVPRASPVQRWHLLNSAAPAAETSPPRGSGPAAAPRRREFPPPESHRLVDSCKEPRALPGSPKFRQWPQSGRSPPLGAAHLQNWLYGGIVSAF